jgi:hypothetical protein
MQVQDAPNPGLAGPSFEKDVSAWPRLKIARAIQHIKDLEGRVSVWTSGRPFTTESGIAEDRLRWQVKMRVFTPPPLFEWSLVLGDCFHALRGSLDACVWELAHLNGAVPPKPHMLQFPILEDEAKWERVKRERLQTVPDEIADRIRVLQPFNRASRDVSRDPLLRLNWLDVLDKHRSNINVNIIGGRIDTDLRIAWEEPSAAERNLPPRVIYHTPELIDGAVLMEFHSQDPLANAEGGCSFQFSLTAATPDGTEDLFGLANNMIQYVQLVHDGLLSGLVRDEGVTESEAEEDPGWQDIQMVQEGNAFRSVREG